MTFLELVGSFIFGALVGSFLNVCIWRLPRKESIITPRSRCPHCKTPISWYDNIPIISFFFLRGRCRYCKTPISWRYPVIEAISGVISTTLYLRSGFTLSFFFFFAFFATLLIISMIDLDFQIIPDEISLPGIVIGWLYSFFNPLANPIQSFLGSLAGAGSLYLVAEFYYFFTKREGIGGGDVKLFAFIGSFLGLRSLLPIIFISSLMGAVIGISVAIIQNVQHKRHLAVPFGPFLSIGALIYLFCPNVADSILDLWIKL